MDSTKKGVLESSVVMLIKKMEWSVKKRKKGCLKSIHRMVVRFSKCRPILQKKKLQIINRGQEVVANSQGSQF